MESRLWGPLMRKMHEIEAHRPLCANRVELILHKINSNASDETRLIGWTIVVSENTRRAHTHKLN